MTRRPDWVPGAGIATLRRRAELLAAVRTFFAARGVWEVETPLLASAGATDPAIESFALIAGGRRYWLQSSPEFHMKRLLAAGSGAIYQIARAFRQEEAGRWHNPEFTLLEWYRPGFSLAALMDEVESLLRALVPALPGAPFARRSYRAVFREHLNLDPHAADASRLRAALAAAGCDLPEGLDRDQLLDAAMGLVIGPRLGPEAPEFVTDYPATQAALARLNTHGLASRFELYWRGLELANGFHELADAAEQRARFAADTARRAARGQPTVAVDEKLLAALEAGLPDACGVALGLDRLCALWLAKDDLGAVMAFTQETA